jgi:hypothetical protein
MSVPSPSSAAPIFWNMRRVRQLHNYIGVFFAPAILFFAISGSLQTFGLHESRGDAAYKPPAWIVTIASIHKDQKLPHARPKHQEPNGSNTRAPKRPPSLEAEDGGASPLPLKIFVLCLALGLITSASLGVTISLKNKATRRATLLLLAAGTALPVLLLFL